MPVPKQPVLLHLLRSSPCGGSSLECQAIRYIADEKMGSDVDRGATWRLRYAVHDHILFPPNSCFLDPQLGDTTRTISDFGYSEVELVLCFYLKQLWITDSPRLSATFFQRLDAPTWRSMKLLEAFLQCMKSNNASDFSLPTETHTAALNAFYNNGLKQVMYCSPTQP